MQNLRIFFTELLSQSIFISKYAIQLFGLISLSYGVVLLYQVITGNISRPMTPELFFLAAAALVASFGFIMAVVISVVRTSKGKSKVLSTETGFTRVAEKRKKQTKHSKYPDLFIKTLVNEYDNDVNVRSKGMGWVKLCISTGVFDDYTRKITNKNVVNDSSFIGEMEEVIRILKGEDYIFTEGATSDPMFRPTYKGIIHAHWLMRPWYKKIWDDIKAHIITIIVAIIVTIATSFIIGFMK